MEHQRVKTEEEKGKWLDRPVYATPQVLTTEPSGADVPRPAITEREFLPDNAIPLDQEARDQRKLARLARNPTRVLIKGGKRVIAVKVKVPIDQYAGLQRFEGATDSEKVLTLLRIANRRVDQAEYDLIKERAQAAIDPPR